jgi:hypothetical protein
MMLLLDVVHLGTFPIFQRELQSDENRSLEIHHSDTEKEPTPPTK